MVQVLSSNEFFMGLNINRIKPTTVILVFVASLLSMQNQGKRTKNGWLRIRRMCQRGAKCYHAD